MFSLLLAIVLLAPKFLFFGTLGYAIGTFSLFKVRKGKLNFPRFYWSYIVFYSMYIISLLWTDNIPIGTRDVEFKLMFLAIPPLMAISKWNEKDLLSLNIGFNLVIFCCLGLAWQTYLACYDPINGCFAHQQNSGNVHPTYKAMFANTALLLSLYFILFVKNEWQKGKRIIFYFFQLISIGAAALLIVMVDSKAGILTILIGPALLFMYWLKIKFSKKVLIATIVLSAIVFSLGIYKILQLKEFKEGIVVFKEYLEDREAFVSENCYTLESNRARILVWDSSLSLLKENPFGLGPGDVSDELIDSYRVQDYPRIYQKKLNPHNQLLQTSLALGIPGLLLLLYILYKGLSLGIKRNYILLSIFSFLIIFNALFESILELQVGIFYFVFFSLIFEQLSRKHQDFEQA